MHLRPIKYHQCALDQGEGILLVDIDTETIPRKNKHGHRLYYCMARHHLFAVDLSGEVVPDKSPTLQEQASFS